MIVLPNAPFIIPPPSSVSEYKQIFQRGRGYPWGNHSQIYRGRRAQRGFGLFGSVFKLLKSVARPLVRAILPVAKSIGKKATKQAFEVGKDILIEGKKPREVFKRRGKQLLSEVVQGDILQKGRGRKNGLKTRKRSRPSNEDLLDQELWIPPQKKARTRNLYSQQRI